MNIDGLSFHRPRPASRLIHAEGYAASLMPPIHNLRVIPPCPVYDTRTLRNLTCRTEPAHRPRTKAQRHSLDPRQEAKAEVYKARRSRPRYRGR
jgi:hypothetical protein